jgi:CHAT domain-containing protein
MGRLSGHAAILLAAGWLMVGCTAPAPGGAQKAKDEGGQPLGRNLVAEECRGVPGRDVVNDPNAPGRVDISCGKDAELAGVVHASFLPLSLPASGLARREAVEKAARETFAGAGIAARMSCQKGHWVSGDNGDEAMLQLCVSREGNWPQIVVTAPVGKTLYQAEGLPVLVPVFAAAIQAQSGTAVGLGDAASSLDRLEAILDARLPVFGAGDLNAYNALMRAARYYNSSRNSAAAEAAYRRALDIQTRVFGPTASGVGETLAALALEVSNQGRFEEALGLFRRAEPILDRSPDVLARARMLSYEALDAANQGHYADALTYARSATALRRGQLDAPGGGDLGSVGSQAVDRGEVAHSLSIEAAMALRLDDLPTAEVAATEALEIIASTPGLPPWWRPKALAMMGEVNGREGRFAAAERNDLDALAFNQRLFGETAPTALSYISLGHLYADEDQLPDSVKSYRSAFGILEKDRAARSDFAFDQLAPFLKAATTLAARDPEQRPGLDADMFQAIQLTSAGVADQTIARASARLEASDPATADLARQVQEAQRKRDAARLELANETAKPDDQRGAVREASLIQEIQTQGAASEQLLAQLEAVFPAYKKFTNPGGVDLAEIQHLLNRNEAVVAFAIGREQAYGVLARSDRLIVRPLPTTDKELADAVRELRNEVLPRLDGIPPFDLRASYDLYKQLLAPFAQALDGVDHLVVVASGPLSSLPLGILTTSPPPPGKQHDYVHAPFLVRKLALSQIPSVRAFASLREAGPHRVRPAYPLVAFANPSFAGGPQAVSGTAPGTTKVSALDTLETECRDDGPIPGDLLRALEPLPETADEVTRVARLVNADPKSIHVGTDASETTLRGLPLDQYAILYFATHGLLPGELRCQSEPGLVLSPPPTPAKDKSEDGLLDATEIAALKLNADLVVLSACNTAAAGGLFGGEALSGLAEAFFYAGARTLLASHWEVDSNTTVQLMTGMFARLGPGFAHEGGGGENGSAGIAASLRQSQLALLDQPQTAHPFFWAAFTVIGDGGTAVATKVIAASGQ